YGREANGGSSSAARNGTGDTPDPGHAPQTAGFSRETPSDSQPDPETATGEPNPPAGAFRAGELTGNSCPACGHQVVRLLFTGTDRLYGTTDRVFQVVECASCRLIRLHPKPAPEELQQYYPPNYWYVREPAAAARLEQR